MNFVSWWGTFLTTFITAMFCTYAALPSNGVVFILYLAQYKLGDHYRNADIYADIFFIPA